MDLDMRLAWAKVTKVQDMESDDVAEALPLPILLARASIQATPHMNTLFRPQAYISNGG